MVENIKPKTSLIHEEHNENLNDENLEEQLMLNASAVFATPIERDGITVIPVAKVEYGTGVGEENPESAGHKDGKSNNPVQVRPLGYIEVKNGHSNFRPIKDPLAKLQLVVAGIFFGAVAISRLYKLLRPKTQ